MFCRRPHGAANVATLFEYGEPGELAGGGGGGAGGGSEWKNIHLVKAATFRVAGKMAR